MGPTLIALAGPARSGKGTCASIFTDGAQVLGLSVRERQLSGPGKQYVASAFRPEITEEEAVEWFDELKKSLTPVKVYAAWTEEGPYDFNTHRRVEAPLQVYLQRMLQGARDRWGKDFWTDKLLPQFYTTLTDGSFSHYRWWESFSIRDDGCVWNEAHCADLCVVSDLRQESEAERVKELRGYIVEMQRPPIEHGYVTGADHVTEQRLSDIRPDLVDYVIEGFADHNDETLALLKQRCSAAWADFVRPLLQEARCA